MAADWDKFDALFNCPATVTDKDLRAGYEAFYARMRGESEGLEYSSAQIMRTSVMLNWFFKHQQTSRKPYGDAAYNHPGQEKDAILAWEQVAKTWDDVRMKAMRPGAGLTKEQVAEVCFKVLAAVPDPAERALLQDKFADALEAV